MPEYNWQESLDFRFYDFYERNDVDLIYIDEENPSSIALNFEIRNKSGIELVLEPYNQGSKVESKNQDTKAQQNTNTTIAQENTLAENAAIVSQDNFHIEIRFRPGTLSAASLVQIDLSEATKEEWLMSRPLFHNNNEISLYFLKCGRPLTLIDSSKTTLTLRGFAANSAGGSRGTNAIINYNEFHPKNDTIPIAGTKVLNLTILGHRGQRKAPLAICFANQNTILNNGEIAGDIELQITNIGREPIALSPKSEFMIEIDAQAEGKEEPWAVAKKDEAANFNITIKKREIEESNNKYWCWNVDSSTIDKNTEEPRFTFRNIYRQLGSKQAVASTVVKDAKELELPKNLEEDVIQFITDSTKTQVAYPGTVWKNSTGYSLCFQEDGNLVLYNSSNRPLWGSETYQFEGRADTLKFHPNGNLVLYQKGEPIWSTKTQKSQRDSQVYLELQKNGNFVIYDVKNPSQFLFETKTKDGVVGNLAAAQGWKKSSEDTYDSSHETEASVVLESNYSFPSNEDLIFVLSNVKSSLESGQGQIRVYYKDIPGYADGYQILNLYKTHLIEREKKIGIGKTPKKELDVKGSISATETVTAKSFIGQGAIVKGMIVMWYGESNNVPEGWAICDGSKGTPDLRDRFIIGAGHKPIGSTGGSPSVTFTINNMPSHKHRGTTNQSGRHNHKYNTAVVSQQDHDDDKERWSWKYEDKYTEDGGEHQHSFETDEQGNGQPFEILPPYLALFFIMKL